MPGLRIEIDRDLCSGNGLCCEQAPQTFALDADRLAVVAAADGDPPEYVLSAARNCPLGAISVYNQATGARVWPPEPGAP